MFALPSLATLKELGVALGIIAAALISAYFTHRVDAARLADLERQYAQAQTEAVQQAMERQQHLDQVAIQQAEQAATSQARIAANVRAQLQDVQQHVRYLSTHTVRGRVVGCVTYGLIRMLDAAVRSVSPDSLRLPSSKSDDTCAPVSAAALARSIIDNYGTAKLNADQLDRLIESIKTLRKTK